ncbi:MAG: endoglucanase [Frankiaceae bacterium]|nr:endoglucanase [Frankiaceae bacterium]
MNSRLLALIATASIGFLVAGCAPVAVVGSSSLRNASLEAAGSPSAPPNCWEASGSGANDYRMWRSPIAHSGRSAEWVGIWRRTSGSRGLRVQTGASGCAPRVRAGQQFDLSAWYQLVGHAMIATSYQTADGDWHAWVSSPPMNEGTGWHKASFRTPPMPPDASRLSFGLTLDSRGLLGMDDFAMTEVPSTTSPSIHVDGSQLKDENGQPVQLRGVNVSGTQYACTSPVRDDSDPGNPKIEIGYGIFDPPSQADPGVMDANITAMKSWHVNAVRISLNEDCWLGINGVQPQFSGPQYQAAITDYVNRILAQGMYVILDLAFTAPGTELATYDNGTAPMADRDHSPHFWSSVAATFQHSPGVLFDLYNEPHPDGNQNTTAAWQCVRDGGTCAGVPFTAAGSQTMLDAVRAAGASNVVLVGGPQYAGVLDQWSAYKPADPLGQLAASSHIYFNTPGTLESQDWSPCYQQSCWESQIAPLAKDVPVVIGEFGEHDCAFDLLDGSGVVPEPQQPLLDWADKAGVSYLAWAWFAGNCAGEPALISDYSGAPTAYGAGVHDHLVNHP